MLSKSQIKLITSLQQKKYRNSLGLFVVEGIKVVNEFLDSDFELEKLYCISDFKCHISKDLKVEITDKELKKISSLIKPNKVLAIFKIPQKHNVNYLGFTVVLDGINDPGNLGTIIRLCDWFGVKQLICSENTVDCYNSKVIQATMGSLKRVAVSYEDIETYILNSKLPVFAADMVGDNVYESNLPSDAILVMGNEANGISDLIQNLISNKISIPRFGAIQETESLNVASATAILLSEFKRS